MFFKCFYPLNQTMLSLPTLVDKPIYTMTSSNLNIRADYRLYIIVFSVLQIIMIAIKCITPSSGLEIEI